MSARRIRSWKRFDNRSANAAEPDPQLAGTGGRPKVSTRALAQVIERSSRIQGPAAQAYVARLRRAHPGASPRQDRSQARETLLVGGDGQWSGGRCGRDLTGDRHPGRMVRRGRRGCRVPRGHRAVRAGAGLGTRHSLDHRERRRALVLAVLVGDNTTAVADLLGPGRTSGGWVSETMASLPLPAISSLNSRMLKYVVKRFALKRGALMFGKLVPMGIGAIIGAIGNRLVGKKLVRNARSAFGTPPARWPVTLHVLPTVRDAS